MAKECLIVHHGSTLSNCEKIKKDKKFIPSENKIELMDNIINKNGKYHWLGRGIYFWHNDRERAFYWAKSYVAVNGGKPAVIEVPIKYNANRCFNLCNKTNFDYE